MTTSVRREFGAKKATLRLGFEERLAHRLLKVCRNLHSPTWTSGGFPMTSVHATP